MEQLRETLLQLTSQHSPQQIMSECHKVLIKHIDNSAEDVKIPILYCAQYGGFGFSDEFLEFLGLDFIVDGRDLYEDVLRFGRSLEPCKDPLKLGLERASGRHCTLAVAYVRKTRGYNITEYDGKERVHEADPLAIITHV